MYTMREAWTDERLDDLSERMDRGFDRVDKDLRELKKAVDITQRLLVQVCVGMSAAMVTGFVGLATLIVATS